MNNFFNLFKTLNHNAQRVIIIQLYDASGRHNPNPNLRLKVNNNGTAIWKTFPKLY